MGDLSARGILALHVIRARNSESPILYITLFGIKPKEYRS